TKSRLDMDRRERLRQGSGLYGVFEYLIQRRAPRIRGNTAPARPGQLGLDIKGGRIALPRLPPGDLRLLRVASVLGGLGGGLLVMVLSQSLLGGVVFGLLFGWVTYQIIAGDAARRAAARRRELTSRLPFTIDLMAMMMESGATFPRALEAAV